MPEAISNMMNAPTAEPSDREPVSRSRLAPSSKLLLIRDLAMLASPVPAVTSGQADTGLLRLVQGKPA